MIIRLARLECGCWWRDSAWDNALEELRQQLEEDVRAGHRGTTSNV